MFGCRDVGVARRQLTVLELNAVTVAGRAAQNAVPADVDSSEATIPSNVCVLPRQEGVMPQSIPPGLNEEHVVQTLNDPDSGIDHP